MEINRSEELKQLYFEKFEIQLNTLEEVETELKKVNELIEQEELRLKNENEFKWDEYE